MNSKADVEEDRTIRVMFVCLGNICRSPLAEGIFRDLVTKAGLDDCFEIRSSGTGDWHVGGSADSRMCSTAERYGVVLTSHCAAQFTPEDLEKFDHIFVMDKRNLHDVLFLDEQDRYGYKVRLLREFDPQPGDYEVPDPYYGGPKGFDEVYHMVCRTAQVILDRLIEEYDLQSAA